MRHVIGLDDVQLFHHYVSGGEDMVVAILRVEPTESNGFDKVSKYLRAIDGEGDMHVILKKVILCWTLDDEYILYRNKI